MSLFHSAVLAASVAACSGSPSGVGEAPEHAPPPPSPAGEVLFIGNSLTAANNLPGMVESLAESAGDAGLSTAAVTLAVPHSRITGQKAVLSERSLAVGGGS